MNASDRSLRGVPRLARKEGQGPNVKNPRLCRGIFIAYLTGHPRREPGDECKSRRKKTEFSFCLSAAGKIKRSWDFETKEAPGGSPGSFTSTYKVGAQAKYKGENLRCNSNIKSALAKGTEKS